MAKIKKAVTMADIAENLDVSTVTVSKALSGQKGVSEEMRMKIRELAEELGYKTPSAAAENTGKSYNIGILISDRYLADFASFYWKMYQEIADRAIQKECFTLFEIVGRQMEENNQLPRILQEKKVDGLIVVGKPGYNYEAFLRNEVDMPMVFLDFYAEDPEVDCLISDGFYGAYLLTKFLIKKGHEKIAYVGTLYSTQSITDRYMGYLKALMEHGIEAKPEYLIADRDVNSGLRDNYGNHKFPEDMPTAFVCNCDFIASLIIKELQERGYRVPEDISVVGYDNYLYPGLCDVGITTYEVDIKEFAKKAINILLKKLNQDNYKRGIHIVEGRLVEKESAAERRKASR